MRYNPTINGVGHKIQPSPKIPEDFRRRPIYLWRWSQNDRLTKWIYKGGQVVRLPKSINRGMPLKRTVSGKWPKAQRGPKDPLPMLRIYSKVRVWRLLLLSLFQPSLSSLPKALCLLSLCLSVFVRGCGSLPTTLCLSAEVANARLAVAGTMLAPREPRAPDVSEGRAPSRGGVLASWQLPSSGP